MNNLVSLELFVLGPDPSRPAQDDNLIKASPNHFQKITPPASADSIPQHHPSMRPSGCPTWLGESMCHR